jgi:hypothetical protein
MPIAHGALERSYIGYGLGFCLTALDQVIDAKQDESSDEGHEEAGGLVWLIVADGATKECSQKRAGDADEHGNEDAAGFFAGNNELGECADNQTDESRPKQMKHICSSVLVFPGLPDTSRLMGKEYSYCGSMQASDLIEI